MLDDRLQMLPPRACCAITSSDPKCFSQVVVDGHLLAATETCWTVLRLDRAKRSAVVPGSAAVLAFFFNLDHVGRLYFRIAVKERGFSASMADALNVVSSFVLLNGLSPYRRGNHSECSTS